MTGKIGERKVRIVGESVPHLWEWVQKHSGLNNPVAMVFLSASGKDSGKPINYDEVLRAWGKG